MTTTLSTPCFTVENGQIVEGTLADFDRFIETTTRPAGVGPKYYVTTISRTLDAVVDDDDNEIEPERTVDVWVLAKWATWGGPEVIVRQYESEEEAQAAAEETYVHDILHNNERTIHLDRADAARELAALQEDEE